jgi:hypothetical protein
MVLFWLFEGGSRFLSCQFLRLIRSAPADRAAVAIIMTSALVLGLIAGQVRDLTCSLWPAVVVHYSANAAGTLL